MYHSTLHNSHVARFVYFACRAPRFHGVCKVSIFHRLRICRAIGVQGNLPITHNGT